MNDEDRKQNEKGFSSCCPTCGRQYSYNPRRICTKCKEQITRHHKWFITDEGKIRHRNCKEPSSYLMEQEKEAHDELSGETKI